MKKLTIKEAKHLALAYSTFYIFILAITVFLSESVYFVFTGSLFLPAIESIYFILRFSGVSSLVLTFFYLFSSEYRQE